MASALQLVPIDEDAAAAADEHRPANHDEPLMRSGDYCMLGLLAFSVVAVVLRMVVKDSTVGLETDRCFAEQGVISKHMHCVSTNGTHSFADFLATQGAKKGHPYYEQEKERVQEQKSRHRHPTTSDYHRRSLLDAASDGSSAGGSRTGGSSASSSASSSAGGSNATRTPLCAGASIVTFLNVHLPKAAGSSAECTLSGKGTLERTGKSIWPFDISEVVRARSGVEFREFGNHNTYQDFMSGLPGASAAVRAAYPLGPCPHPTGVWPAGGQGCTPHHTHQAAAAAAAAATAPTPSAAAHEHTASASPPLALPSSCTPLVTWMQDPAKRFVSAFYEHSGRGARNHPSAAEKASELIRRYDEGRITPDELVKWPKRNEISGFLYHAASQRRNYMLWNHVAQ